MKYLSYTTLVGGIGLIGLALYQFSQGDVSSALNSVITALGSFGITVGLNQHQTLVENLNRQGILPDEDSK